MNMEHLAKQLTMEEEKMELDRLRNVEARLKLRNTQQLQYLRKLPTDHAKKMLLNAAYVQVMVKKIVGAFNFRKL